MTDRIPEYSFFRAEGLSLAAVETAEEARAEFHSLRKKLQDRFGSRAIFVTTDKDTNKLVIDCFAFNRDDKTPEGWDIDRPRDDEDSSTLASGMPKPGTADAFYLASMTGLMERAAKNMHIENVFGCGDMPRKELPAGKYHGEFVRNNSLETEGEKPVGRLRDRATFCFGSNGRMTMGDPVDYMQLDGAWYLRIPNKKDAAEPQFMPPDAIPVSYEEVLERDRTEYNKRYGAPRSGYGGPIC